jgi:hypothetical protein
LSTEEARPLLASHGLDGLVPAEVVSGTRTHALTGAAGATAPRLVLTATGRTLLRSFARRTRGQRACVHGARTQYTTVGSPASGPTGQVRGRTFWTGTS